MNIVWTLLARMSSAALLLFLFTSTLWADIFVQGDPFYIEAGKEQNKNARIEGNCIGPCANVPDKNIRLGGGERSNAGASQVEQPGNLTSLNRSPFQRYKDVMGEGGNGPGSDDWTFLRNFSSLPHPRLVMSRAESLFSPTMLLPDEVVDTWFSDARRISQLVAEEKLISVSTPPLFPTLPNHDAVAKKFADEVFIPLYGSAHLTNWQDVYNNYVAMLDTFIMSSYEKRFSKMENEVIAVNLDATTKLLNLYGTRKRDVEIGSNRVCQDARRLLNAYSSLSLRLGPLNYDPQAQGNKELFRGSGIFDGQTSDKRNLDRKARNTLQRKFPPPSTRAFKRTFLEISSAPETTRQGRIAKALAKFLAIDGNQAWNGSSTFNRQLAEQRRREALVVVEIAFGVVRMAGESRDIYEAYTKEDLLTGDILNDDEHSIRVLSAASLGFAHLMPRAAIASVFTHMRKFGTKISSPLRRNLARAAEFLGTSPKWTEIVRNLGKAEMTAFSSADAGGKAVSLGKLTRAEMNQVGQILVGPDSTVLREEHRIVYVSRDGTRQYKAPIRDSQAEAIFGELGYRADYAGPWQPGIAFSVTSDYPGHDIGPLFEGGRIPRASELKDWATNQGWAARSKNQGPLHFVDADGVDRLYLKRGSSRTPGSESPHVAFKAPNGRWIDPWGAPASRKRNSHYPIEWDL